MVSPTELAVHIRSLRAVARLAAPVGVLAGSVGLFALFIRGPRQCATLLFAPFVLANVRQAYMLAATERAAAQEFTTAVHVAFAVLCLLLTMFQDAEQLSEHIELCIPLVPVATVAFLLSGISVGLSSKTPQALRLRCGTRALFAVTVRVLDSALAAARTGNMGALTVLLTWTITPYVLGLFLPSCTEKLFRCGEIANALEQQEKKIAELRDDLNTARDEIEQCDEHAEQLMQQSSWYHRQLQGLMNSLGRGSGAHSDHEVA